jgi:ribonuclease VapC
MTEIVLDASVLLALFGHERGWEEAQSLVGDGVISSVNLAEVVTKLIEKGASPDQALALVDGLSCRIVDVDRRQGLRMGTLHAQTRGRNISLGDRACLALGEQLGLPIVTADRAWAALDLGLEIRLLR